MDELKRAGDEIHNFTVWNDRAYALSTFTQVNAQDILLEEKRKMILGDVLPWRVVEVNESPKSQALLGKIRKDDCYSGLLVR